MGEVSVEVLRSDVDHMKVDITDIKSTVKEQGVAMLSMRDAHIENKFYMKQIQENQATQSRDAKDYQVTQAKETKEYQVATAKEAKKNQESTMSAIQAMKDEKGNAWKQMSMAWKIGIGMIIISYVGGTIFGILKNMAN